MEISQQYLLFSFIFGLAFGWGCSYLAAQKGRDPKVWFLAGFFFGLLGLIVLMIIPDLRAKESKKTEQEDQLPEVNVSEIFNPGAHEWYFLDSEGTQNGPVTFSCLEKLFEDKKISSISYVWSEGMEEWKTIEECNLFTS